jgi:hypothetical protein
MKLPPVSVALYCGLVGLISLYALVRFPYAWDGATLIGLGLIAYTIMGLIGLWQMRRWGVILIGLFLLIRIGWAACWANWGQGAQDPHVAKVLGGMLGLMIFALCLGPHRQQFR